MLQSNEAVKADLVMWLFGALVAQGGQIVALAKLLAARASPKRNCR